MELNLKLQAATGEYSKLQGGQYLPLLFPVLHLELIPKLILCLPL